MPVANRSDNDHEGEHVHLHVVDAPPTGEPVPRWRRWLVIGVMAAGVAIIASAFFKPWWEFTLYAPQYPHGLRLVLALTGVSGDVGEIDELNHYIGMAKLEGLATTELHYAAYGVGAVAVMVLVFTLLLGRKLGKWTALPALAFPAGFVVDAFYWLYRAGHEMDPHAAIHLPSFTPQMFGNGQIGQFMTFAQPSLGFWMACLGAAFVIAGTVLRQRTVCAHCTQRGTCGAVCVNAFIVRKEHGT